jgi:sensor histidine kinase YesM
MYGDKVKANEQLNNFTYLTRQILEVSGKKLISIATEIDLLTKYLELEKMRFDQDFSYEITVSSAIDPDYHQLPPMLLQPFVENSIKHGLMHKKGHKKCSLHFELSENEDQLICTIIDNGIGRQKSAEIKTNSPTSHASFSTQSIEERLKLLNPKPSLQPAIMYTNLTENEEIMGTKVDIFIPMGSY